MRMTRRQWMEAAGLALVVPGVAKGDATRLDDVLKGKVCEVCGKPARCGVADQQETKPKDGWRCWRMHSAHWFCERHTRQPIEYGPRCEVCGKEGEWMRIEVTANWPPLSSGMRQYKTVLLRHCVCKRPSLTKHRILANEMARDNQP